MDADKSGPMYQEFLDLLSKQYKPEKIKGLLPHMLIFWDQLKFMFITGGQFQAYMQVHIQNDGPVTLDIDSPYIPPPKEVRQSPEDNTKCQALQIFK